MKYILLITISCLLIFNRSNFILAEDTTPAPTENSAKDITGREEYKELFSKKLEATDYLICNSKVMLTKNDTENEKKTEILVEQISRRGKNGNSIYSDLETAIEKAKADAINNCNKEKSQASCVKNALLKNQSEYQLLDFQARKAYLDAAEAECKAIKYECEGVHSSKIVCDIYQDPDSITAPTPEPTKAPEAKK